MGRQFAAPPGERLELRFANRASLTERQPDAPVIRITEAGDVVVYTPQQE